jgi:hypothetical protein
MSYPATLESPDALKRRFEKFHIPEPNSGCWLWIAFINETNGYGYFRMRKRGAVRAHRVAHEIYKGPITSGLNVLHTCDNRACVNPEHLYLGTYLDNARDRDQRQRRRAPKGMLNGRAKLTESDVRAIRLDPRSETAIARAYGVGFTAISDIKEGRKWTHLT